MIYFTQFDEAERHAGNVVMKPVLLQPEAEGRICTAVMRGSQRLSLLCTSEKFWLAICSSGMFFPILTTKAAGRLFRTNAAAFL